MQIYRKTTQQMMADTRDKLILDLRKDREFRRGAYLLGRSEKSDAGAAKGQADLYDVLYRRNQR